MVVLTDQHHVGLEARREGEGVVHVGLARRAVAAEAHGDAPGPPRAHGHGRAHGLRHLRTDAARPRDLVGGASREVRGHLPSLLHVERVAPALGEVRREGKASHQHRRALAEPGEDPVVAVEREGRRDGRGLLPLHLAVEPDAPLALHEQHLLVEEAQPTELAVHPQQGVVVEAYVTGRVARVVEHTMEAEHRVVGGCEYVGHGARRYTEPRGAANVRTHPARGP